jgi:hypothetical protein
VAAGDPILAEEEEEAMIARWCRKEGVWGGGCRGGCRVQCMSDDGTVVQEGRGLGRRM